MKPSLVIVGLGNPGQNYDRTRHNVGFRAIDVLSQEYGAGDWTEKQKFLSSIQEARIVTVPVLLVKPNTYMNCSGDAVQKIVDFFKIDASQQLIVLCDDVDLPLAELRMRKKGGPGTHNGLKSLVHIFGEEFTRIRIGLGTSPAGVDLAAWVLSTFSKDEETAVEDSLKKLPAMIREFVLEDG